MHCLVYTCVWFVSAFSYQECLASYVYTLLDNSNCINRNAEGCHTMSIWLHFVVMW